MKCINMQIGGIVIFLANFITIYSTSSQQDKMSPQTTTVNDNNNFKSKLNKDCPKLLEIISIVNKKYNVTDFGIDCKTFPSVPVSKETTLEHVCFVIKDLLNVMCDKKLAETETAIQKTEIPAVSSKIEQQQEKNEILKPKTETTVGKVSEAAVTASKVMKMENKTEKPEAITTTPKKEQTSESEVKSLGNENFMPDNIDEEPNEDDLGVVGISSDVAAVPNIPKMESVEDKNSISSPKIYSDNGFFQAEDSHFFFYFLMVSSVIVLGYLAFHNKNKILAYALEGASSRRRGRRPNPARYKKLETNLEEVISSNSTNVAASSVVY